MSCDHPILTHDQLNAQEQDGFPQAPNGPDGKPRFSLDEPDLAANRKYIANLPPIAERVECARTFLAGIDPNSDSWKCEPQSLAAFRVVLEFAVDPRYAWDLVADFNRRCTPPLSEDGLRELIAQADGVARLRGLQLLVQVKERADDPHALAELFLLRDETDEQQPRWCYWRDEWFRWDGSRYVAIAEKELRARLTDVIRKELLAHQQQECRRLRSDYEKRLAACAVLSGSKPPQPPTMPQVIPVTSQMVNNTMQALASITLLPFATEQPSWLGEGANAESRRCIAFANGLIDLEAALEETATLEPHSPQWFSPVCLPFDWDPEADCPQWLAALNLTFGGDAGRITLLQEWFGYCLTPSTDYQKFLMLVGEGNNGKSVICAALTAVLGQDNVSNVSLEAFAERFALTSTIGKLANIAAEVGELDKTAEGKLKSFTSGDRMTFDRKNKTPVETVPTARLVLATNNLPRFSDRTNGLWRRLLLVPCDVTIPDNKRVAGMDKPKYWEESGELPGILQWALAGLRRLRQQKKFTEPQVCKEAVAKHRKESNPALTFLLEHCKIGPEGCYAPVDDVYQAYSKWCKLNGYFKPLASCQFGKELKRQFPKAERKHQGSRGERTWVYQGVVLDPPLSYWSSIEGIPRPRW